MNTPVMYSAPWGRTLRVITIGCSILCLVLYAAAFPTVSLHLHKPPSYWVWLALPLIIAGAALFTVRGYGISKDALLIERLFWTTRIPLDGLLSARVEQNAMCGSIRTCGNGGLFSFTGWYWSRRLGHYRAFVTDFNRTVVLRFARRTIVVSPDDAEGFVATVMRRGACS